MDNTFKCSSILIAQLCIIRPEFNGNIRTCEYPFLPYKLENAYQEMLSNVIIESLRNKIPLKPE